MARSPAQPRADEPIRLRHTRDGEARYTAVVDTTPKDERGRVAGRRQQARRTFTTLGDARRWVTERQHARSSGDGYNAPSTETIQALCGRWLESRRKVRRVTAEGYASVLRPVVRQLGDREVRSLTIGDVEGLVAWLEAEGGQRGQALSPRTVRASMTALSQAFDLAVREQIITDNVTKHVERKAPAERVGTDLEHWQPEQLLRFVEVADGDRLAAAWRLSSAGLRRSEVMGLRWCDVNEATAKVTVAQGRVQVTPTETTVGKPKSKASRRTLVVDVAYPGTTDRLRAFRLSQVEACIALGRRPDSRSLVVTDELGEPVRPEWYSDRFRRIAREAGLPPIKLHSLRHSLAFWLHREGLTPADAAAWLGHSVEVHLATYLPASSDAGLAFAAQALGRRNAAV